MHFAQKNGFWKTCRIMSKTIPQYIEIKFVEMWITYVEMWITSPLFHNFGLKFQILVIKI